MPEFTKAWQLFQPLPVVMISTLDESGFTRCSPFSWVIPLHKDNEFGVAMRDTSCTLYNIRNLTHLFTMSWLRADSEVAQRVLLSRKGPNAIDLVERFDTRYKVPADAIAVAECMMLSAVKLSTSYHLVVCALGSWRLLCPEEEFNPLVFCGFKTFGITQKFEVEGY